MVCEHADYAAYNVPPLQGGISYGPCPQGVALGYQRAPLWGFEPFVDNPFEPIGDNPMNRLLPIPTGHHPMNRLLPTPKGYHATASLLNHLRQPQ